MRILLLNQFLPPDPSPTAKLLGDLANELQNRGHDVEQIGNTSNYHDKKTRFGSRALRETMALAGLLFRACRAPKCDVIFCLTSPPLVPVVGYLARWKHRGARMIHWAMDVYPDVAVCLDEIEDGSAIHRIAHHWMTRAYQTCEKVVALDSDMENRLAKQGIKAAIQHPWPPAIPADVQILSAPAETFTWLYSGNLGRAHEWETILEAQAILEAEGKPIDLIFQGGGSEVEAAKRTAHALGLKRCQWRPYADPDQLIATLTNAHCLIATQRPETKGCLWPSKLSLATLLGRPIVWIGPKNGSISKWLSGLGHGCFAPGESQEVAAFIADLSRRSSQAGPTDIEEILRQVEKERAKGIDFISNLVETRP